MNVHPLLVHFPVAFLTAYSIFELLSFTKFSKQNFWFYIKACLIFMGVIGALFAIGAGLLIENQFSNMQLVVLHKNINLTATSIFAVMALGYLTSWLRRDNILSDSSSNLGWRIVMAVEKFVIDTPLKYLLALTGLILITLGGALGGAIAYGPDLDPFTRFVYDLVIH